MNEASSTGDQTLHLILPDDDALVDGSAVTFEWRGSAGDATYTLEVAADASFSDVQISTDVGSATSITLYDLLPPSGESLYWRVHARRGGDVVVSDAKHVQVRRKTQPTMANENAARPEQDPRSPVPIAPSDGEAADGLATTFIWKGVQDATYRLQIAADEAFQTLLFDTDLGTTTQLTTYDVLPLDGPDLYWRVEASSAGSSVWGPVARFNSVSDYSEQTVRTAPVMPASPSSASPVSPAQIQDNEGRSSMPLVIAWVVLTIALGLLLILKVLLSG